MSQARVLSPKILLSLRTFEYGFDRIRRTTIDRLSTRCLIAADGSHLVEKHTLTRLSLSDHDPSTTRWSTRRRREAPKALLILLPKEMPSETSIVDEPSKERNNGVDLLLVNVLVCICLFERQETCREWKSNERRDERLLFVA